MEKIYIFVSIIIFIQFCILAFIIFYIEKVAFGIKTIISENNILVVGEMKSIYNPQYFLSMIESIAESISSDTTKPNDTTISDTTISDITKPTTNPTTKPTIKPSGTTSSLKIYN